MANFKGVILQCMVSAFQCEVTCGLFIDSRRIRQYFNRRATLAESGPGVVVDVAGRPGFQHMMAALASMLPLLLRLMRPPFERVFCYAIE
jgi:hypothetical protein